MSGVRVTRRAVQERPEQGANRLPHACRAASYACQPAWRYSAAAAAGSAALITPLQMVGTRGQV